LAATACDLAQLLNVLFGNTSLHPDVECADAVFPRSLIEALHGPRFGIEGLRKAVGVYERALTCTAAKPMGLAPQALAELVRQFARAGIDVVKDDHGLAEHAFCPFEARVDACLAAADAVADETGRRQALYEPVHGSAPDIAGEGKANPIAMLTSYAMMLRYSFDMPDEANLVETAIDNVLAGGLRTGDIMQTGKARVSTKVMGEAIVAELNQVAEAA